MAKQVRERRKRKYREGRRVEQEERGTQTQTRANALPAAFNGGNQLRIGLSWTRNERRSIAPCKWKETSN